VYAQNLPYVVERSGLEGNGVSKLGKQSVSSAFVGGGGLRVIDLMAQHLNAQKR